MLNWRVAPLSYSEAIRMVALEPSGQSALRSRRTRGLSQNPVCTEWRERWHGMEGRVGRLAVYALLDRGEIPAIRLGRRWIVTRHAYEQWERTCGTKSEHTAVQSSYGRL
jgi:hypothetical protein